MKLRKTKSHFDELMNDLAWFRHNCPNGVEDVKRLRRENQALRERVRKLEKQAKLRA